MEYEDVLLIHMGGLGDMCLSESTFLSLSQHFQRNISALGYPRFFNFFHTYFKTINSIESAKWLYLFSDYPSKNTWKRIAFIGKDRNGELRRRWQAISEEELIFIDMYPDSTFGAVSDKFCNSGHPSSTAGQERNLEIEDDRPTLGGAITMDNRSSCALSDSLGRLKNASLVSRPSSVGSYIYVEDYQLMQLEQYGIKPIKKDIQQRSRKRVILYPEVGVTKSKWHHENFIELYHVLKKRSIEVYIFESFGLSLPITDKVIIEDLVDVKAFFNAGGIFVSNDSGMAHFAGICGLFTLTIFSDFEPTIWHPRGENISLRLGVNNVDVSEMEKMIFRLMDYGNGRSEGRRQLSLARDQDGGNK
jgi:hypothetical protein